MQLLFLNSARKGALGRHVFPPGPGHGLIFEGSSLDMLVITTFTTSLLFDKESLQFAIKNHINYNEVIIILLTSANRFAVNKFKALKFLNDCRIYRIIQQYKVDFTHQFESFRNISLKRRCAQRQKYIFISNLLSLCVWQQQPPHQIRSDHPSR